MGIEHAAGLIVLGVSAAVAGAINSVAGGGTLISFPTLVAFGVPPIAANATNTAAMWPGSLGSAIAYSRDTHLPRHLVWPLLLPSALGALAGAFALVATPPAVFARTVPILVLFATLLFAFRARITRALRLGRRDEHITTAGRVWGFLFQLFVAAYGGYFGAGIGLLMLGSLSIMGLHDIHKMNGLKTVLATVINVIAFLFFILKGLIVWPLAILMAASATVGGYAGARLAKRVPPTWIHGFVIAVGFAVSGWLFVR